MREALEYTQEEFAEHVGIDRAYYGGIERGQRNFTIGSAIRIARGLGVDIGELVPAAAYRITVGPRRRVKKKAAAKK